MSGSRMGLPRYVESSYTPVFTFATTEPTGLTYSSATGPYTVIGNRCLFNARLSLSSKGTGGVGAVRFSLPIAPASGSDQALTVFGQQINATSVSYMALAVAGQTYAQIYEASDDATASAISWAIIKDSTTIYLSGCYRI